MGRLVRRISFALVSMVTAILMVSAAPIRAEEQSAKALYKQALELFRAEEFVAALPFFKEAYEKSVQRPVTVLGLAQCERALKLYDDAVKHFEEYLASNPPAEKAERIRRTLKLTRVVQATTLRIAAKNKPPPAKPKLMVEPKLIPAPKLPPVKVRVSTVKETSILENHWLWVATGVAVLGAAVATGFAISGDEPPYAGTSNVVIQSADR